MSQGAPSFPQNYGRDNFRNTQMPPQGQGVGPNNGGQTSSSNQVTQVAAIMGGPEENELIMNGYEGDTRDELHMDPAGGLMHGQGAQNHAAARSNNM